MTGLDHARKPEFPPAVISIEYAGGHWTRRLGPSGEYAVGRTDACDVTLDDPAVSRRHALLFAHAGCLRIVALPDASPVYVNQEAVEERFLADRDIVRLGDTTLYVHYPPLPGDRTSDPRGLPNAGRRRTANSEMTVERAVLSLARHYGSTFASLRREVLDEQLSELLGVSSARARRLLDAALDEPSRREHRGTARYVAVAEALSGDGTRRTTPRNRRHKRG